MHVSVLNRQIARGSIAELGCVRREEMKHGDAPQFIAGWRGWGFDTRYKIGIKKRGKL